MSAAPHPPTEVLFAFLQGRLTGVEAAEVEAHLATCAACADIPMPPDDGFLRLAREVAPGRSTPTPREEPELPGYEVLGELGRGGMGVVYKARHLELNRVVALKMIRAGGQAGNAELARFKAEAQALARLQHPNIVQIFEVGEHGGKPFFSLEFCPGGSLQRKLDGTPLPAKEAARLVEILARATHAAHEANVVHRDLKPANVLLSAACGLAGGDHEAAKPQAATNEFVPKITDFGLAKKLDEAGQTSTGAILGTPSYMAPEQAQGKKEVGPLADVYALGAILYECLTGHPPFEGGTPLDTILQVLSEEPRPPRQLQPDVPHDLENICLKCLHKEPGGRYASACALAEDLARFLNRKPILARPAPVWERAWKGARRRPAGAALLGTLLAAGLLAVALLARPGRNSPGGREPPPPEPGVLTVSQKRSDGGQFRTIGEALDAVQPGLIIRVLDDADYQEYLPINRPEQYRGVVLEAAGKATLRKVPGKSDMVLIRGVPGFTLRGFRFVSGVEPHAQVHINGRCPGVILDGLHMACEAHNCIELAHVPLSGTDDPIVIQNCTIRSGDCGILVEGLEHWRPDHPTPCNHVVVRNNALVDSAAGVTVRGEVHKVQVVGNRILDTQFGAIGLIDFLPGSADVLVANNTLLRNQHALRIWDNSGEEQAFLKCKNIRFQNNLVLAPRLPADLIFFAHPRGDFRHLRPGPLDPLLKSPEWHFSHNWREVDPVQAARPRPDCSWIPACPKDHLEAQIEVLSRTRGDPNFLRPPKGSPLGTAGAGVTDSALPAYVGAVAPEGVEPWDWQKTWDAFSR